MGKFTVFMSLRILDLFSTYINVVKYGGWEGIEANPFANFLMEELGFAPYIFMNLCASALIFLVIKEIKILYLPLIIIMALVVLSNFAIYIFI